MDQNISRMPLAKMQIYFLWLMYELSITHWYSQAESRGNGTQDRNVVMGWCKSGEGNSQEHGREALERCHVGSRWRALATDRVV